MTTPLLESEPRQVAPAIAPTFRRRVSWRRRFVRNRGAVVGLVIVLLLAMVTLLPGLFMTHDPNEQDVLHRFAPVGSAGHLLGTDNLGRDLYSRLLAGIGVTVLAALLAVAVATVIGVPAGLVAGYRGGRLDRVFSAVSDGAMSIPAIIAVIAVVSALGPGLMKAMITVGVFLSARMFRVQRATTISTRHETYIEASEALGCRPRRVLLRHVLPNSLSPTIVQATLIFGSAILAESALSFVGLGVVSPQASLGALIADASPRINQHPFMIVPPGVAAAVMVLAFALVGEGLKDALGGRKVTR
jgi:peptide/nickel transport system permease protein